MEKPKKIVDARKDKGGNISHVLFEGNERNTPIQKAVEMADKGKIEGAHGVHPKKGDPYLRSNPDNKKRNNLDFMADN